jgi:hypothetical protein
MTAWKTAAHSVGMGPVGRAAGSVAARHARPGLSCRAWPAPSASAASAGPGRPRPARPRWESQGRDARDVRTQTGRDATRDGGGGQKLDTIEIHGEGGWPGRSTASEPTTVGIDSTGITLEIGSARPIRAGFRDISLIAIQQATVLLVLGDGPDAMRSSSRSSPTGSGRWFGCCASFGSSSA